MNKSFKQALIRLPLGSVLGVPAQRGQSIAVTCGLLWVTQEGNLRDVFLAAGESFTLDQNGLLVIEALETTSGVVFDGFPNTVPVVDMLGYEAAWPSRSLDEIDSFGERLVVNEADQNRIKLQQLIGEAGRIHVAQRASAGSRVAANSVADSAADFK